MAIDGKTKAAVSTLVTDINTSETQFMEGMNDIINQVDTDSELIDQTVTITVTGDDVVDTDATFNLKTNSITPTLNVTLDTDIITTARLVDGSVTTAKIADDAVTSAKIATNAVTNDGLGFLSVGTNNLQTDAVTTAKINANAVTQGKMSISGSSSSGQLLSTTGTALEWVSGVVNASQFADGSADSDVLATDSVITEKIKDGAVTSAKLASNANIHSADEVDIHLDQSNNNRPLVWNTGTATPNGTARTLGANNADLAYNPSTNNLILSPTGASITLGGWTIVENSSGGLDFNRGTDTLFRIESDGDVHADGDITAFSNTI